ncbi:hypothetical protein BKA83DRAFT_674169 [Pisolithus microcarpus]|nr:hypothetical protein BKA83DRAFT_674169 [Pisolithus microcarpus]
MTTLPTQTSDTTRQTGRPIASVASSCAIVLLCKLTLPYVSMLYLPFLKLLHCIEPSR